MTYYQCEKGSVTAGDGGFALAEVYNAVFPVFLRVLKHIFLTNLEQSEQMVLSDRFLCFKTKHQLLQMFSRMLQHYFTLKPEKYSIRNFAFDFSPLPKTYSQTFKDLKKQAQFSVSDISNQL